MSRIRDTFKKMSEEGRRGFIPFVTAGDPDMRTTVHLLIELARAGATLIELGVPFSDPMADGPVIQRSSERALRAGTNVAEVLRAVAEARKFVDVPVVLFSYFNPLLQFGVERLCGEASLAGIDGILVTDLVPEESGEFTKALAGRGLDFIVLAAPTSTERRLHMIAECASGFIYAVSRAGVTGARTELSAEAEGLVRRVRMTSGLPVAVGFGISTAEQVAQVWRYADAAVIGSAIVSEVERRAGQPDLVKHVGSFARSLLPTHVAAATPRH